MYSVVMFDLGTALDPVSVPVSLPIVHIVLGTRSSARSSHQPSCQNPAGHELFSKFTTRKMKKMDMFDYLLVFI